MARRTIRATALLLAGIGVVLLGTASSPGATGVTVVGATVPSATTLVTTGCASGVAGKTDFGVVLPGSNRVTTIDCTVQFGSSNDTSTLRAYQQDAGGYAMTGTPAAGVVGEWHLNDSLVDSAPIGNPMLFDQSDPAYATGPVAHGSGVDLDGNDGMRVAYNAAYDLDVFTLDLWVKPITITAGTFPVVINKDTGPGTNRNFNIHFWANCGCPGPALRASFSHSGTQEDFGMPLAADGTWHHVAMTIDAAKVARLYLDGVEGANRPFAGNVDNPALPIKIGRNSGDVQYFIGQVDQVRLHDVARTPGEIRSYASGALPDYLTGSVDWGSPGLFGACLRALTVGTPVWTVDATCNATTGPYWNGIATTSGMVGSRIATTASAAGTATAELRFGMRTPPNQPPGRYAAPITFEVVAPST